MNRNQDAHFAQGAALDTDSRIEAIRERLREVLARKKVKSRRAFAELAGLSDNTIGNLLKRPDMTPDPDTLAAVERVLKEVETGVRSRRELPLADFLSLALAVVKKAERYGVREVADTISAIGDGDDGDPVKDLALGDVEPVEGDGQAKRRSNGA